MSTRRLRRPTKRAFRRPVRRLCATQTAFPAASFRPVSRESSTSRATRTAWRTPPRHASRRHGSGRGTPRFSRAKPGEARGGGGFGGTPLGAAAKAISRRRLLFRKRRCGCTRAGRVFARARGERAPPPTLRPPRRAMPPSFALVRFSPTRRRRFDRPTRLASYQLPMFQIHPPVSPRRAAHDSLPRRRYPPFLDRRDPQTRRTRPRRVRRRGSIS
mmetsp:Transcript_2225/g.7741  ORF Transcript_2225/g.7741 Transcript_2225/m.7741 type:complete len:216 (-) Transcript_2225:251-898(-)